MRIKNILKLAFLLFLVVGTVVILRNNKPALAYHTSEGKIYGTTYRIVYEHTDKLDSALLATMKRVDASLSMFNKQSTISQINTNQSNKADSLLLFTLRLARDIYERTDGAFDITVGPLVDFWGFGTTSRKVPEKTEIDSLLLVVGMDKLTVSENEIIKSNPRIKLDFSAIAKGLGVDLVAEHLENQNVKNYFVEIGGEIVCKGLNQRGEHWIIGVSKPSFNGDKGIDVCLQSTEKMAIATSGNYNNYYVKDGKRIAHTISPKTGLPVEHELLSVSVIAKSCAIADAYATAFMVMGVKEACKIVESDSTLAAYFICNDTIEYTPRFKEYIKR